MNIIRNSCINLGPTNIDFIEENIYLGTLAAAKDIDILNKYKITHILTIDNGPLPRNISEMKHITTKYIQLSDHPKEDLLSHFEEADSFIKEGLSKGVVLIHCFFGVSRSAALVIAHIMKKYQLTYREAFERVKAKRSIVYPNQGFVSQLKLYKEMGFAIDPSHMHYKMHRLIVVGDKIRKGLKPLALAELIQPDPGFEPKEPDGNVYRCRRCQRILALESNVLLHKDQGEICTRKLFVEPVAWMNVMHVTGSRLVCPKCTSKLGSFSWIKGCPCSCGVIVSPAFYLSPSRLVFGR